MRETRVMTEDLRVAIERSGYYPGLVTDAVASALGPEPVTAFFVHHDAIFDPGMEVRRHMTVLALTPTRLVYSHTDEHPAEEPDTRPRAETSTEAIRFSRVSSVSLTRVVPDPASYVPGVTMPSEVILTIGWNVLAHVELEPAHCGDDTCEADHGYLGTITADDLTLRVSEAADGEEAVRQVLSFVSALSDATARASNLPRARTVCSRDAPRLALGRRRCVHARCRPALDAAARGWQHIPNNRRATGFGTHEQTRIHDPRA
jgi:hypothetical protein